MWCSSRAWSAVLGLSLSVCVYLLGLSLSVCVYVLGLSLTLHLRVLRMINFYKVSATVILCSKSRRGLIFEKYPQHAREMSCSSRDRSVALDPSLRFYSCYECGGREPTQLYTPAKQICLFATMLAICFLVFTPPHTPSTSPPPLLPPTTTLLTIALFFVTLFST